MADNRIALGIVGAGIMGERLLGAALSQAGDFIRIGGIWDLSPEAMARIRAAFPDWREEVEDVVFEGDRIAVRYVSTGTQDGAFLGRPPSGARVRVDEISIFRIADGRIAEQWCLNDDLAFFKQIGQGGA